MPITIKGKEKKHFGKKVKIKIPLKNYLQLQEKIEEIENYGHHRFLKKLSEIANTLLARIRGLF